MKIVKPTFLCFYYRQKECNWLQVIIFTHYFKISVGSLLGITNFFFFQRFQEYNWFFSHRCHIRSSLNSLQLQNAMLEEIFSIRNFKLLKSVRHAAKQLLLIIKDHISTLLLSINKCFHVTDQWFQSRQVLYIQGIPYGPVVLKHTYYIGLGNFIF